jgi:hypothetical protein
MYDPKHIINLIADNVRKTKNPFGIPRFAVNNWWKKKRCPPAGRCPAVYRVDVPVRSLHRKINVLFDPL